MMLLIAIATLVYSGYRAELNQENQTARSTGFEVLKALNTLQMIADAHRYTPNTAPSYLDGWTQILLIDDLADFIAPSIENKAEDLHTVWQENQTARSAGFEVLKALNTLQMIADAHRYTPNTAPAIKTTRTSLKEAIQNLH
jgi:hypothetical protein